MYVKNSRGLTLIELLATLAISFIIMGLVSSVLIQSYRNKEISDTHISLRQEANIIISILSNAHEKSDYTIKYNRNLVGDWEILIGGHKIQSLDFNVHLILASGNSIIEIDTSLDHPSSIEQTLEVIVKVPLHVQKLKLADKSDPMKYFEINTRISRL